MPLPLEGLGAPVIFPENNAYGEAPYISSLARTIILAIRGRVTLDRKVAKLTAH
jgi:hypothetical protein